jgi:hypothetical protein
MRFVKIDNALVDVMPGLGLGSVFVTSRAGVVGYLIAASLLEAGHESVEVGIWKGD